MSQYFSLAATFVLFIVKFLYWYVVDLRFKIASFRRSPTTDDGSEGVPELFGHDTVNYKVTGVRYQDDQVANGYQSCY